MDNIMGLEYNLFKITESEITEFEKLKELKIELAPRNQCKLYVQDNGGKAQLIEKQELDSYYHQKEFLDGPNKDSFGDGYGEPYNPNRQAFGKLKTGVIVYCELSEDYCKKTKELLRKINELADK